MSLLAESNRCSMAIESLPRSLITKILFDFYRISRTISADMSLFRGAILILECALSRSWKYFFTEPKLLPCAATKYFHWIQIDLRNLWRSFQTGLIRRSIKASAVCSSYRTDVVENTMIILFNSIHPDRIRSELVFTSCEKEECFWSKDSSETRIVRDLYERKELEG